MIRVLITGAQGQLGQSIRKVSEEYPGFSFIYTDIHNLDLTHSSLVRRFISDHPVDCIINCAAYTAVDNAEGEPDKAYAINRDVPATLGEICREKGIYLLHLSTDYVYNGSYASPHTEEENPGAACIYGLSKLEGEKALYHNEQSMIIRTSWLYGEYGQNFMTSILNHASKRKELNVVFDQTGSPTYSGDLARALLDIILYSKTRGFMPGVYNYSNEGVCSWYDFALEIVAIAQMNCMIKPIRTSEYPLVAIRPAYSVMDKSKIRRIFELQIPHWKQSLKIAFNNFYLNRLT
jgi:dTDP-4-dehydrorhamnose reductase